MAFPTTIYTQAILALITKILFLFKVFFLLYLTTNLIFATKMQLLVFEPTDASNTDFQLVSFANHTSSLFA
jgi:hypothetical protein